MYPSKLSGPPPKDSRLYFGQQTLDKLLKLDSEFFQLPHKGIKGSDTKNIDLARDRK